jgi:hypothetical protein
MEEEATPDTLAPDLTLSDAFMAGSTLIVTVTNNGTDVAQQVIVLAIYDASVTQLLKAVQAGPISLASGQSVDISTGFQVQGSESRRIVIFVNPDQTIEEFDYSNNSLTFVVGGAAPIETPDGGDAAATPIATEAPTLETPVATETPAAGTP